MKYVLDTNIFSEITKPQPRSNVIFWLQDFVDETFTTSITIKELYYGLFIMPEGKRKNRLRESIDAMIRDYTDRTFAFDAFDGYLCAELDAAAKRKGYTPTIEDCMIAAICKRHDATLVTHNVKDFEHYDIKVYDPYDYESETLKMLRRREAERNATEQQREAGI